MKLFCWCGAIEQYAPPIVLLLLVVAFIMGTIGKLLGWSDPAAPTIKPPEPETVEEPKRRKTHAGVERKSRVQNSNSKIVAQNESQHQQTMTSSPSTTKKKTTDNHVSIEMVDQQSNVEISNKEAKQKETPSKSKSKNDIDSTKFSSYTDMALSTAGPKKKNKPKPTEPRNSVDLEPSFVEEERLSRPRPVRENSRDGKRGGTPSISYDSKTPPKGTAIPASASFSDERNSSPRVAVRNTSKAPKDSTRTSSPERRSYNEERHSSPRTGVRNTSKAPKDSTRTSSPVRTRSPPTTRKTTSGSSLLNPNDRSSSKLDEDTGVSKAKRNTSPPRPKRPTSPPRNRSPGRNSGGEPERTRWGGVQTENSPAASVRTKSPMRPSSTDLDMEGGQDATL